LEIAARSAGNEICRALRRYCVPTFAPGLDSSDESELRCDQCHSVSRVAFELIQQETPSNRSLNFVLDQGAKRYQKRTRSETWIAVRANGRMPASKILAHLVHCN
jgi:hypothetical protein